MAVFVFGNAPSIQQWNGFTPHPSIGCNFAIRDFDFDHLVAVDRMTIASIRGWIPRPNTRYWCKTSVLETPEGWTAFDIPGIDSGSAALQLAINLYPGERIIAVGFDGVLGGENRTNYHYPFRQTDQPAEAIRKRHRLTVVELSRQADIEFVYEELDRELKTISYDTARRIAETQG